MIARSWQGAALAGLLALAACDRKPAPVSGSSGPRRELETASNPGGSGRQTGPNPAPVVDPFGAVGSYKTMKHDLGLTNNLREIYKGLEMYAANHGEYPPAGQMFKALVEANTLGVLEVFAMPKSQVTREGVCDGTGKGVYTTTKDKLSDNTAREKPIIWEPEPWFDGRQVLRMDGQVILMTEEDFQSAYGKHEGK